MLAILDDIMGALGFALDRPGFSVDLNFKLLKPVLVELSIVGETSHIILKHTPVCHILHTLGSNHSKTGKVSSPLVLHWILLTHTHVTAIARVELCDEQGQVCSTGSGLFIQAR